MANKIELTQSFRPTTVEKKKKPEERNGASLAKWREVEERKDSPKSHGLAKNEKPASGKKPLSLKDRESKKAEVKKDVSPFELFSHFQVKPTKEREAEVEFAPIPEEEEVEVVLTEEEKAEVELAPISPTMITAAPHQIGNSLNSSVSTTTSPVGSSTFQNMKLFDFVEKLVKKITAMKVSGRTEITLTLKNLSLFNGGVVKVVEHDSSRGQYNIMFSNLNAKAHALVTSQHAERLLRETLEQKGFAFHIISATTEIEPVTTFAMEKESKKEEPSSNEDEEQSA